MAPFLVPVSATSANSLERQIQHAKDYCESRTVAARDLAHTLGARRDHYRHRAFAVITGDNSISEFPFHFPAPSLPASSCFYPLTVPFAILSSALIWYSSGEIAAAYAAHSTTAEAAITIA